ncbi:hypothetical protein [Nocardioides kribbensis]|uniref:hypothetical protein n=1 Tax=Nocardioides kribbensis TaxID=305517 RepID=UPI001879A9EA|nr:hypothetical protein [Nocardioides kribbensis]
MRDDDVSTAGMHPMYAAIGPFYDSDGARAQLDGLDELGLEAQRKSGAVLAMQAGDDSWLYPAWQFTGSGTVHPALVPVLEVLRVLDPWAAGVWLINPHPDLDGKSPREALRKSVAPSVIVRLARHDVHTLTS